VQYLSIWAGSYDDKKNWRWTDKKKRDQDGQNFHHHCHHLSTLSYSQGEYVIFIVMIAGDQNVQNFHHQCHYLSSLSYYTLSER
jgi:hypothetical protein